MKLAELQRYFARSRHLHPAARAGRRKHGREGRAAFGERTARQLQSRLPFPFTRRPGVRCSSAGSERLRRP